MIKKELEYYSGEVGPQKAAALENAEAEYKNISDQLDSLKKAGTDRFSQQYLDLESKEFTLKNNVETAKFEYENTLESSEFADNKLSQNKKFLNSIIEKAKQGELGRIKYTQTGTAGHYRFDYDFDK